MGVPRSEKMSESWDTSFLPWNKGMRVSNSANMQPSDQMSISEEYSGDPRRSSGALYHRVTTSWVSIGGGLDV